MKCGIHTSLFFLYAMLCMHTGLWAQDAAVISEPAAELDSVIVPPGQEVLFVLPKANLLTTRVDMGIGISRVKPGDNASLGVTAAVKGLYLFSGALYSNLGMGLSRFSSYEVPAEGQGSIKRHTTAAVQFPIGFGIVFGDDRAMVVNGIDFIPAVYIDHPSVARVRRFAWGFAPELGFHIIAGNRLHLGMIGKVQFIQSHDRDEHTDFPRFGMLTFGLLAQYN